MEAVPASLTAKSANWKRKQQITIVNCSAHAVIVLPPSIATYCVWHIFEYATLRQQYLGFMSYLRYNKILKSLVCLHSIFIDS